MKHKGNEFEEILFDPHSLLIHALHVVAGNIARHSSTHVSEIFVIVKENRPGLCTLRRVNGTSQGSYVATVRREEW